MFQKLECVCIHTDNLQQSLDFYTAMGLIENWKIERPLENGVIWTLLGLKFPSNTGSELVLSDHPDHQFTEIEILVDDVRQTYLQLSHNDAVSWIKAPFPTESGHVAVMKAPDNNVFVLVGK